MKKFSFALAATMLGLACAPQAGAMTLTFGSGVSGNSSSSAASCASPYTGDFFDGCTTNAFVSGSIVTSSDLFMNLDTFGGGGQALGTESFASAFGNALPGWTLASGDLSALSGITLTVTNFSAGSYPYIGGIGGDSAHNITISVTGVDSLAGGLANQLVWIQGLEINYTPGSTPDNFNTAINYNTLDDATFNGLAADCQAVPAGSPADVPPTPSGGYCDPIYPYQYSNHQFYDAPMGPWPNGSFRGIALLATIDPGAQTVTTYGGVSYGFDNAVAPEPGTWVLLLAGAAAIFLARRRATARG